MKKEKNKANFSVIDEGMQTYKYDLCFWAICRTWKANNVSCIHSLLFLWRGDGYTRLDNTATALFLRIEREWGGSGCVCGQIAVTLHLLPKFRKRLNCTFESIYIVSDKIAYIPLRGTELHSAHILRSLA
ncbi:hypothetical protein AYI68_g1885 [Smittium mucronatum]|uniref:Uncharacterized protein n=1 Tax=Smittium mucronatum TaxID=133383 RepID=A0A1R0H4D4_9FUNG|nr:hypothetical protein AYI68_g1885 [Smittium mucronatum]